METDLPTESDLSEEQALLQETVRRFAEETVAPRAVAMDRAGRLDPASWGELRELGLTGLTLPDAWGGAGMDAPAMAIAIAELARADGATAWTLASHLALAASPLMLHGTESQQAEWLPGIASGETIAALAVAEPEGGSDLPPGTIADPKGAGFGVHGRKLPVTGFSTANVFLVTAREGPSGPTSLFVVGRGRGVVTGRRIETLGLRAADVGELVLDGCELGPEARIGGSGQAEALLAAAREWSGLAVAALALGLAEGATERARRYSVERRTFGKRIVEHQAIALKLADMDVGLAASRLLVRHAATKLARGEDARREVVHAKLFASEAAVKIAYDVIQVHGGYGYSAEYEVERMWRDARHCTLAEGTSEVLRLWLARQD